MDSISIKTIQVIKSTVPILEKNGEVLARYFYKHMFKHNPEVAPLFNPTHQATGQQQQALAKIICIYAKHISDIGAIDDEIELVAQKHVSFRIKPEHYPIVGKNLIASIKDVLGKGATQEILEAWEEAYNFMAHILMHRERQIYREQQNIPNNWQEFKKFRIIKKEKENNIITSFYLAPKDNQPLPQFKPGQHITIKVPSPCGHTTMRNYSISNQTGQDCFRISIKLHKNTSKNIADGYVSTLLHKKAKIGTVLEIAPPCGEFFLDTTQDNNTPLVLIASEIGIAPIMSILLDSLEKNPNRNIQFIYNDPNGTHIFRQTIETLNLACPNLKIDFCCDKCNSNDKINTMIDIIATNNKDNFYLCGPRQFVVDTHYCLYVHGINNHKIHFEFFGPKQELKDSIKNSN